MQNIAALLDKAKTVHRLPSDYKLALVMGVSFSSLGNYRSGKTLPDSRVISLLCELTGDDPDLLAVEVEAQRAKTDQARALWQRIAARLQVAAVPVLTAILSVLISMVLIAAQPEGTHYAAAQNLTAGALAFLYIVSSVISSLLGTVGRVYRSFLAFGQHGHVAC